MAASHLMPVYGRFNVEFVCGEGTYLFDAEGRRYLDFAAGVAVNALGHAHPDMVDAISEQARRLWHVSNLYPLAAQENVAERLCTASFADRVFFCNSGAEAMEGVIKTTRRYHYARGEADRVDIICFEGAFHGRTLGTLAAGGQEKHLRGFGPPAPGFVHVPPGDIGAVREKISDKTAAILIEPVQGEGGLRVMPAEFLKALRDLCEENGLLLLYDEVQSGMGRTGRLFAHEHAGVTPDIMGLAKGLGGGFPVGAVLATARAASGMGAGAHGSTFGGNPLAMSAVSAVLDNILVQPFLSEVHRRGEELSRGLDALAVNFTSLFHERRGRGLMQGLRCRIENRKMCEALLAAGLLTVPAGDNVVRLLPPLTVSKTEVAQALAIVKGVAENFEDTHAP